MDLKIQWFPGHMTKAKRMMETQIKLVDVVVEMLDARIPQSSTNPLLYDMVGNKPKVIVLNKIDMADNAVTEQWVEYFKSKKITVVTLDCSQGKAPKKLVAAIMQAAKPTIEKWLKKGVRNHPTRVMIIGIPNVGKSTLINRLVGKNKVMAADRPGVTRGQQWITIAKGLELLDTPGVLWPKFDDATVGFDLAVTGAIKEEVFDREAVVEALLEKLRDRYPQQLAAKYNIKVEPDLTGRELVAAIAQAKGALKAGGVLDINKVVQIILREFKTGRMGRFTLDYPYAVEKEDL